MGFGSIHKSKNTFKCSKCGCNTSGIILQEKGMDRRWCPCCRSPLLHCSKCRNRGSGSEVDVRVVCDQCKEVVLKEDLLI